MSTRREEELGRGKRHIPPQILTARLSPERSSYDSKQHSFYAIVLISADNTISPNPQKTPDPVFLSPSRAVDIIKINPLQIYIYRQQHTHNPLSKHSHKTAGTPGSLSLTITHHKHPLASTGSRIVESTHSQYSFRYTQGRTEDIPCGWNPLILAM